MKWNKIRKEGTESTWKSLELKRSPKDRHTQTHGNYIEIFWQARPFFTFLSLNLWFSYFGTFLSSWSEKAWSLLWGADGCKESWNFRQAVSYQLKGYQSWLRAPTYQIYFFPIDTWGSKISQVCASPFLPYLFHFNLPFQVFV